MRMLAYIDPNAFGLPIQMGLPWLLAMLGVGASVILWGWRYIWRITTWMVVPLRKYPVIWIMTALLFGFSVGISAVRFVDVSGHKGQSMSNSVSTYDVSGSEDRSAKVLVLGMDGLDPDIIEAMMDAGELPGFAALRNNGRYGRLATVVPPESPVVWSTFATGLNPGGHGIFDFIHRNPANYQLDLSMNGHKEGGGYLNRRQGKTFWQTLSQAHIPVHLLFAPCSFPPEPVNGFLMSGMGTPDLKGNMGQYTLISSDPTWAERDLTCQLLGISAARTKITLALPGPRIGSRGKLRTLTIPLTLTRNENDSTITLALNKTTFDLAPGQWSPWVHLQFGGVLQKKISGICRFYLRSLNPEINLYCTPIQFDPSDPVFAISYPEDYADTLARQFGAFATLGMPLDTKAYEDDVLDAPAFYEMGSSILDERRDIYFKALENWHEGFLFAYFGEADPIQHMFWQDFLKERLREQGIASLPHPISEFYKKMDNILIKTMKKLDQEPDTQMVIVSDHGFADFRKAVDVNRLLLDLGYLVLKDGYKTSGPMFEHVDWSRSRAYACGFTSLYLNLAGREREGIVQPDQAAPILTRLRRDLLDFVDSQTDEHCFTQIVLTSEHYFGAESQKAPDLVLGFRPGYRAGWMTALGGAGKTTIVVNNKKWRGDHIMDASHVPGVIFMRNHDGDLPGTIQDIGDYVLTQYGMSPALAGNVH